MGHREHGDGERAITLNNHRRMHLACTVSTAADAARGLAALRQTVANQEDLLALTLRPRIGQMIEKRCFTIPLTEKLHDQADARDKHVSCRACAFDRAARHASRDLPENEPNLHVEV